jgi:hypothetical protein
MMIYRIHNILKILFILSKRLEPFQHAQLLPFIKELNCYVISSPGVSPHRDERVRRRSNLYLFDFVNHPSLFTTKSLI